jgi:hypothetical protein
VVARLTAALEPDYVVLGGGNVHKLKTLLPGCRAGDNANAFRGGFRLWEEAGKPPVSYPSEPESLAGGAVGDERASGRLKKPGRPQPPNVPGGGARNP